MSSDPEADALARSALLKTFVDFRLQEHLSIEYFRELGISRTTVTVNDAHYSRRFVLREDGHTN